MSDCTQVVLNEDCRVAYPFKYDVMIADPPYSKHVHDNTTSQSAAGGTRHNDLGFEYLSQDLREKIAGFTSQVKRWSVIYSDIEALHDWRKDVELRQGNYIRAMAWVRWSMPQLSGDRPPTGFELATLYWGREKGRKSWNGPGSLTHLAHKALRGENKHKCEKPLDQALDLVLWFTNPGETVLDPCAGSGVVGLACKILGRSYVGYELQEEWAVKSNERISRDTLSDRDEERLARWKESQDIAVVESAKRKANTDRVRGKKSVEVIG
jgi:DNA modification methylase